VQDLGRGAADAHHPHDGAGRQHLPLVVRARGPLAAVQPHPAVVRRHLGEHDRLLADQGFGARGRPGAGQEMPLGDRPHSAQQGDGRHDRDDALQQDVPAEGRRHRRSEGAAGEHDQDERQRRRLRRGEHAGDDEPDQPIGHG
jgi:hypothetical protein